MKKGKQSRLAHILVCGGLLILVGGATAPVLSAVPAVYAATTSNPVADSTTQRSLTVTKYQAVSANDHGAAGDGNFDQTVTNVPLEGVKFTLYKVTDLSNGNLTDPTKNVEGTDYTKTAVATGTTDANGQIVWSSAADSSKGVSWTGTPFASDTSTDGIYEVVETDNSGAVDPSTGNPVTVVQNSNPFFVYIPQTSRDSSNPGLIYDVNAQPKNVVENDLNPSKTIDTNNSESGVSTDQTGSLVAGNDFTWDLTTNIPNGLYDTAKADTTVPVYAADGSTLLGYYTVKAGQPLYVPANATLDDGTVANNPASASYSVKDTLDKNLTYKSAEVGYVDAKGNYTALPAADYTVNFDSSTGTFTASLTQQGLKDVAALPSGDKIVTKITTTVGEGWDGVLPNTFDVTYTTPGTKPNTQTPPPSETPGYADGGLDIHKVDPGKEDLSGASFMIATSESNANSGLFLASDGKSYQATKDATGGWVVDPSTLPSGVTMLTSKSDSAGHAAFDGLPLDFQSAGADGVVGTSDDTWSRDYWVVETQAPSGYELAKTAYKVTVTNTTSSDADYELTVTDQKQTQLPFTGGAGTAILVTVAFGAIGVGTALVVMDRKKKTANKA